MLPLGSFLSREDGKCDVTLKARDGREFKAHWEALADWSEYFRAMRRCGMREVTTGRVNVDADGDVLEFVLTGMIYRQSTKRVSLDVIKGSLGLLEFWLTSGGDPFFWWDGDVAPLERYEPTDLYMTYGWAVSNKCSSAAKTIAGSIAKRPNQDLQYLEIELRAKVDDIGMWAIKLLAVGLEPEQDVLLIHDCQFLTQTSDDKERRKETVSQMKERWESEGKDLTGDTADRLMRLLRGEEIMDRDKKEFKWTVKEITDLYALACDLGLSTEWLEQHACRLGRKIISDLFEFSGENPRSNLGVALVRNRAHYPKFTVFGSNSLGAQIALNADDLPRW